MPDLLPTTEHINPRTEGLDRLPTEEMLRRINDEDAQVAHAVRAQIGPIAQAVDAVAEAFKRGGRLVYVGAGTSGRLGVLDASECLPTFGVSPDMVFGIIAGGEIALTRAIEGAEDDRNAGEAAINAANVGSNDVVVGISASGGAPYVRGAVMRAKERGAKTVSVVNSFNAPLSGDAEIAIEIVTGPEVITGSTRLKAGTAQKLCLNMISTGAMVKIGKTYGNRMVDVQATNAKLILRARRLVREVGRIASDEEADALLKSADASVKVAVVMARRNIGADEARALLDGANGFLSRVLETAQ